MEVWQDAEELGHDVALDAVDDELAVARRVRALAQAFVDGRRASRQRLLSDSSTETGETKATRHAGNRTSKT